MSKIDQIFLNFFSLKNIKKKSSFYHWYILITFQPSILKWPKGQKYFYGHFHTSLALHLLTTKLRCLQKNIIGHTNLYVCKTFLSVLFSSRYLLAIFLESFTSSKIPRCISRRLEIVCFESTHGWLEDLSCIYLNKLF